MNGPIWKNQFARDREKRRLLPEGGTEVVQTGLTMEEAPAQAMAPAERLVSIQAVLAWTAFDLEQYGAPVEATGRPPKLV
ncbi:hypothetical protein, partial [Mesorhizobium sp. B2-7-1]|uniref:hypothetical protein n=1 Tax=Mesorhizobium sp. B2-7-1 TaxID=2589909 RepID=UPI001AEE6BAF